MEYWCFIFLTRFFHLYWDSHFRDGDESKSSAQTSKLTNFLVGFEPKLWWVQWSEIAHFRSLWHGGPTIISTNTYGIIINWFSIIFITVSNHGYYVLSLESLKSDTDHWFYLETKGYIELLYSNIITFYCHILHKYHMCHLLYFRRDVKILINVTLS